MSKVRFALVGCGAIAKKHAHALHHYVDGAEIGAFVDRDLARAQQLGAEYKVLKEELFQQIGEAADASSQ